MHNTEAVTAIRDKAQQYLDHSEGYTLCFIHLIFFAAFASLLALQSNTLFEWEVRHAISAALFPEDVFGNDLTMINTVELENKAQIVEWFTHAFVSSDSGIFADPACGDGDCDEPLEHSTWRDSNNQKGCRIDCRAWEKDMNSTLRKLIVGLEVDDTLTTAEVAQVRWNLACPTVQHFEDQLMYFDSDQTLTSDSSPWTLMVFDCEWELRVYAPQGGISGYVTFPATSTNDTMVHVDDNEDLTEASNMSKQTTAGSPWLDTYNYTWEGCTTPQPDDNAILGELFLCSDSVDVFLNESVFISNPELVLNLEETVKTVLLSSLLDDGALTVYFNHAQSCTCRGPAYTDCSGNPCPSLIPDDDRDADACPVLCEAFAGSIPIHPRAQCAAVGEGFFENADCDEDDEPHKPNATAPWCIDCDGCNCDEHRHWIGDGFCDEGTSGMNFDCEEFDFDEDDCGATSTEEMEYINTQDSFPCQYEEVVYDLDTLTDAINLKTSGFAYARSAKPQCIVYQVKARSENTTEMGFIKDFWNDQASNETGSSVAITEKNLFEIGAAMGETNLAYREDDDDDENAVCNTNATCLFSQATVPLILTYLNGIGYGDTNPCEMLSEVYGCETGGCGCPVHNCTSTCSGGRTCDDFPWDSCQWLEDNYATDGCDCSGCECSAGFDCPRTCFGMTCDEVVELSFDSNIGYFLSNPEIPDDFIMEYPFLSQDVTFEELQDVYGCNCDGCSSKYIHPFVLADGVSCPIL